MEERVDGVVGGEGDGVVEERKDEETTQARKSKRKSMKHQQICICISDRKLLNRRIMGVAGGMAQWLGVYAAFSEDLSSVPSSNLWHLTTTKNSNSGALFWPP